MKRVMGYPDRWSVAPGETVRFMVSCLDADRYDAQIVRLKQPDAGPLATPFAPEPIAAPCNGGHSGRRQTIPIGSLAVVPAHPALAIAGSFTIAAYVWPTTPTKTRQAIVGTWSEASQTGYGIEIDAKGALSVRIGAGPGRVAELSSRVPLTTRRWYLAAAVFDAERGTLTLWQEPLNAHDFHLENPVVVSTPASVRAAGTSQPLTFAAWSTGAANGPSSCGGLGFARHFNGRIDRPRLAQGALDRAGIAELMKPSVAAPLSDRVLGAWDFSRDIPTETIRDIGPWRLDGTVVNLPTRAVPGHNWTGAEPCWTKSPEQYGAIHFHDDDLVDACWEPDFEFTIPADLRSGVYAAKLSIEGFDYWIPFFVRPPRGKARSTVAFLASTATYTVYLNHRGRYHSLVTERYHGRLMVMDAIDAMLLEHPEMGPRPTTAIPTAAASPIPAATGQCRTSGRPAATGTSTSISSSSIGWRSSAAITTSSPRRTCTAKGSIS